MRLCSRQKSARGDGFGGEVGDGSCRGMWLWWTGTRAAKIPFRQSVAPASTALTFMPERSGTNNAHA